jgi:hypothetical protein
MAKPKVKSTPQKPAQVAQVSPELQAGIDRFAKALGHMILVRVNPEAARRMSEDSA